MCQVARAIVTSGVKIQKWSIYGYVVANPFSTNDYYNLGYWRAGYGLGNTTCSYDTSLPLYQPDWCQTWSGLGCDGNYLVTSLDVVGYSWAKGSHIPTAIGALTNLQSLRLNNVGLTGSIPNFGLSRLTLLSFATNRLTGSVPAFVNAMYTADRARSLVLTANCNLTSSVPAVSGQIGNQGVCTAGPGALTSGTLLLVL